MPLRRSAIRSCKHELEVIMNISKKFLAAGVIATAALGVSTSASAHAPGAIAAIALGGLVVGSAMATGPYYAPAPTPVYYGGGPAYYAPQPVYYGAPAYYPAPRYYGYGYRPHRPYRSVYYR